MGGRLSTKRSSSRKCGGKASIFELLLQLTKLEVTDTDSSELDEWMQQLFVTSIDDVSYDAIETYFKNFVFYNLLQANLSHGHIAKYWERYALFLRYIMDKDRATTLREFDLNDGDPIKTLLTEESVDDGSNKPSTEDPPVKQDISCPSNPHNSECTTSTGNNDPNAESLYMAFGLDDEPGGRQMGLGRRLMAKARALEMEEARNRMITSQESVTSELCDMVVNEPLGENVTEIYEKLRSGKGDTTKYLTPFVISKIFMKCLVDSLNAVELLFHMDYLSYYLEWTTKPIYKLNADEGISLVKGDVTNRSDGSINEVNTGQNSDLNEEGPDDIDENPCITDNVVKEIKKLVKLRSANETVPITAVIRMEAPLILLEEAITSAAAEAWSSPTLEAMKRGYCFIDHKMRIFSLKSIENILKNTNEVVEFMVIPFCTINYGGANVTSNLQNLTTTLIEYVTANIIPHTNAHDTFIKATQSMAADLLTILLSTIVMTPYICTFATSNQDFTYTTSFTWITRIHKRTKAVAPYYYIHMECLRQQMIENPEKLSVKQLQHVVDYYNKKHAPMAYWMLESMRHKIGRSHFMALIQCLIRLFSTTTHHTGHKRHLNNLRNHAVMYILLLVNAEERDQVIFLDEQGKPKESSSSSDASDYDGAEVEAIMRRARLLIPYNLQDQFTKQKTWSFKWVCDVVLPSQMAALAKAMQNMPPTKICNNELWLMLVELLMNDSNFKFTFYAKPAAFIKELMASIKTICILPKEHGKHDPERKSRSKSNTIPTTASPYIRTAIKLLTHYVVHQKENYLEECNVEVEKIVNMTIVVMQWNHQTQKDVHLLHAIYKLANELAWTPTILSKSTSEKLLNVFASWIDQAKIAMKEFHESEIMDHTGAEDVLMLLEMMGVALNFVKGGLSPESIVKNLNIVQSVLDHCNVEIIEELHMDVKNALIDCRSIEEAAELRTVIDMPDVEAMKEHTLKLLEFVALILRTFMGYKMNKMYEFDNTKPGYGHHSVTLAISDLIREINEETLRTKTALALAICMPIDAVEPPKSTPKDIMHYHMAQTWIAAYRAQHQYTLWSYKTETK